MNSQLSETVRRALVEAEKMLRRPNPAVDTHERKTVLAYVQQALREAERV